MEGKINIGPLSNRRTVVTTAGGMISGVVAGLTGTYENNAFLAFSPGVSFGIFMGALLLIFRVTDVIRALGFLILSTITWYAAFRFAKIFWEAIDDFFQSQAIVGTLTGLAAGVLGAALLWGSAALLFRWMRRPRTFGLALTLGGLTGMLLALEFGDGVPLFVFWQGSFAFCMALCFPLADYVLAAQPHD